MTIVLAGAEQARRAAEAIRARTASGFAPETVLILGSGLGSLADRVRDAVSIPYEDLPGFPVLSVTGHRGRLVLGILGGRRVAVLQGRVHLFENGRVDAMAVPILALATLGAGMVIVTCTAGSLHPEMGAGSLMQIVDHINLTGRNPLIGAGGDGRFLDMVGAYDADLRRRSVRVAAALGIPLAEGVYMWFTGPSFETPAEIRAAAVLGADAVGMSTVPEVILARALGLKVAGFALIANAAAGMGGEPLSHALTLSQAGQGAGRLGDLLCGLMEDLSS